MKTYYFLSDLHLRGMQDDKAQKLLRFFISLQDQENTSVVFMVGDIFDLWLGAHDYFLKNYAQLIDQIAIFISSGGEVHYFEGNHDLHLKQFWQDEIGVVVHEGPELFHLQGQAVRVEHGDEMDPEDRGYIFLRWLLRTPIFKFIILNLPGFFVANIGHWMSQTSRQYTNSLRDPQRILNVIHGHAKKKTAENFFDVLISGHVHLRDEFRFEFNKKTVTSFNLGCWDDSQQILRFSSSIWSWQTL